MSRFLSSLALASVLLTSNAGADNLSVKGIFKQGGLVAIKYNEAKTKSITVNDKSIVLDGDGFEYYPISKDALKLVVKHTFKNGTVRVTKFDVKNREYKVQHVKGVKKKHVTPDPKHLARIGKESAEIKESRRSNDIKYFNTLIPSFIQPSEGVVTGVYGSSRTYNGVERSWHKGIDFANKEGTPIVAPLKGKVVLAMKDSYFNGNLVIIDHGKKIYSIYAHMYDIIAQKGDILEVGDPVGLVGTTGRSTGPHLHWGVYVGQQAIEPEFLLKDFKKDK